MSTPNLEQVLHDAQQLSPDDLRRMIEILSQSESSKPAITEEEFQMRLLSKGIIGELPKPLAERVDEDLQPIEVQVQPLSETIIFDSIRTAVDDLDTQRSQSELLTSLVYSVAKFAPRVVFFVVKDGNAIGWKAIGFENGLNDDSISQLSVPTANSGLLSEALTTFSTVTGKSNSPEDISPILRNYGLPAPERAIAVPLAVRGKAAAAVLYADSGTQAEKAINIPAIETLMRVASMGIELLPARRGLESPRPLVTLAALVAALGDIISTHMLPMIYWVAVLIGLFVFEWLANFLLLLLWRNAGNQPKWTTMFAWWKARNEQKIGG
jgi:hypothetical protein